MKSADLSIVRSLRQNLCPNNTILDFWEQDREMVPLYWNKSPNVRTCSNVFVEGTNPCKMMAIISPWWISMQSSQIFWKSWRIGYLPLFCPSCDLWAWALLLFAPSQGHYVLCHGCQIIQTLSSIPQCLVKRNLVFLRAIHIRSDGMWS
jgi:hypothetical protein